MTRNNERKGGRLASITAHVLLVVIIFILPEMLMRYAAGWRTHGHTPWWFYAKSGLMIAVFYINYFVIISRTLIRRKRWWSFILWNVLLLVAMTLLMWYMGHLGYDGPRHRHGLRNPETLRVILMQTSFMLRDFIMLALSVALALAMRLSGRFIDMERRRSDLDAARRAAELSSLRSQLNPHFLFNSLNTIYALIDISPDDARRAVHDLSTLLRHVVYENPERVGLDSEIDFINNYVELMRLRMGDRPVTVDIDVEAPEQISVPPLLFVTLIENAFKHGNTGCISDPIEISLAVKDRRLTFTTVNSVEPDTVAAGAGGVGLANLRRRLELIYGDRATLAAGRDGNIFTATITIGMP